jgi:hypothetical protein
LETPGLAERLLQVLKPSLQGSESRKRRENGLPHEEEIL